MLTYENQYWPTHQNIAGLDEAGRGCWAGPVSAAAVILPRDCAALQGVNDSKQLTAEKREHFFNLITQHAVAFGIGLIEPQVIDEINILQATKQAMLLALAQLQTPPDFLMIDGKNMNLATTLPQISIIDGDALSLSIAAASILAKVTRDRIMQGYAHDYPGYGFEKHKGYGTLLHRQALAQKGATPIHRFSYKPIQGLLSP